MRLYGPSQGLSKRPNYSGVVIDAMLKTADMKKSIKFCGFEALIAHLSLALASRGFNVKAVEPKNEMRALGKERIRHLTNFDCKKGVDEATKPKSAFIEMITFGSSFNVCDPKLSLWEKVLILKLNGWFACIYNNRYLCDPIQLNTKNIIKKTHKEYKYVFTRENHEKIIEESELFCLIVQICSSIINKQKIKACVEAWRSHATLARQTASKFDLIIKFMKDYLKGLVSDKIEVSYQTDIWLAKLK